MEQEPYIGRIRAYNAENPKTYRITTFGCQMNAHDSEKLAGMLAEMGYAPAVDEQSADLIVYNTCCVRESAENRIFGNLGWLKHLKETRKDLRIAVCGCMAQRDSAVEKIRGTYQHVDIVFGTFNLHKFPQLLCDNIETGSRIIDIWKEHGEFGETPDAWAGGVSQETRPAPALRADRHRASVNIMYGCDNYCSYCIVPYVRGAERSRPHEEVVAEIANLAADGAREILLLGQNVNSYRSDGKDFTGLLERILGNPGCDGVRRIRFMTSHPKDVSDGLIGVIARSDRICKHFHLPVQSGSTSVLSRMNRKYTKQGYLDLVGRIRDRIPGIAFTTDIIVGFPGETEADFQDTLGVVEKVRFHGAYTFLYSKRSGTPAAEMDGQVPEDIANGRFRRLLDAVNPIVLGRNREMEGTVVKVLCDGFEIKDGTGIITGRADNNTIVHFHGDRELVGNIVNVRVTEGKPFYVMGEMT